jgi:hypothetical protein
MYIVNQIGEINPQLLREIKGRFTPVNIAIITGISLLSQLFLYLLYQSNLPTYEGWNRYCTADQCFQDFHGKWVIMENLWWLDIFIALSTIGMIGLLVLGTYLLLSDLETEAKKGTLDFIRLTPTQAQTIFLGKILGVPSLIYLGAIAALPLHLFSGLQAGIPWFLLLSYYVVLLAGLFCCYSLAIATSLVMPKIGGFQPWLISGLVFFLASSFGMSVASRYFDPIGHVFDWLFIFHPAIVLNYLVKATFLAPDTVGYFDLNNLAKLEWYGQPVFAQATTGIALILFNYALWSYWGWQGIKRRFHNPTATALTKRQSYWLSFSFIFVALGFTLQQSLAHNQIESFAALGLTNLVFCLILIAVLTPQSQVIRDWSRYRHQEKATRGNVWKDLLLGEKSPGLLAIAVNLGITTLYIIPCVLLFLRPAARLAIFSGWLLNVNLILFIAVIFQMIMLLKRPKSPVMAASVLSLGGLIIFPLLVFAVFNIQPTSYPWLWLFSAIPMLGTEYALGMSILFACLSQWLAITLLTGGVTYTLRKIGESETKMLTAAK